MAASATAKIAVVTGASSGIGRALALELASKGINVFAVARRESLLKELAAANSSIVPVTADVSTSEGRAAVSKAISDAGKTVDVLVHNAAVLGPLGPLLDVSEEEYLKAMKINVDAPLFLTKALLPLFTKPGGRILNISSGAAHNAYEGMNLYCATKHALFFQFQALKQEFEAGHHGGEAPADTQQLWIGTAQPGIVETGMQQTMRATDTDRFPSASFFKQMHEGMAKHAKQSDAAAPPSDALDTAENVAKFMSWLLLDVPADEFSAAEWNIRDSSHHARWVKA